MAARKSALLTTSRPPPRLFTAQELADFCEVDLKTVHHWADRGRVIHHRTLGRHLRFRRNDIVRFLRAHGYPLPDAITRARPTAAVAFAEAPRGSPLTVDEIGKRLASRLSPRRYATAVAALAHLIAEAPDALVLDSEDPSLSIRQVVRALKADPATSWVCVAAVGGDSALADAAREAGADVALAAYESPRLAPELTRALAVV